MQLISSWLLTAVLHSSLLLTACSSGTEQQTEQTPSLQEPPAENTENTVSVVADTLVLSKDELLGKINPASHRGFVKIAQQYTDKSNIYLKQETYEAFEQMAAAAREEGIIFTIVSATRNFADQKAIWEAKWTGQRKVDNQDISKTIPDPRQRALKILEYSSMPGSSRHHWGTDMDLNALTNEYFDTGEGKKMYDWLLAHAAEYGFCQVYTVKGPERPHGYNEERWHWSYMPLSSQFLAQYHEKITNEDISGFKGSESAGLIDIIPHYVEGIGPACKNWGQ